MDAVSLFKRLGLILENEDGKENKGTGRNQGTEVLESTEGLFQDSLPNE